MTDAFEQFVEEHGTRLRRFAYALCGDVSMADDLVQEALLKSWSHWSRVAQVSQPLAYVRRVLVNAYLTSRRRRRLLLLGDAPPGVMPDMSDELSERDRMWQALVTLSAPQRAALVLRYYEGLDDAEIAGILGCPRSTVRSHVFRGLERLRLHPSIRREEIGR